MCKLVFCAVHLWQTALSDVVNEFLLNHHNRIYTIHKFGTHHHLSCNVVEFLHDESSFYVLSRICFKIVKVYQDNKVSIKFD